MSTNSRIGMVMKDGSVKSIFCQWDGYPSNNGTILLRDYQDPMKIEELINLGAISYLAPNIYTDEKHSFDKPVDGVVVAYHRDRGEELYIHEDKDIESFKNGRLEEWNYLFENGEWYVSMGNHKTKGWCKLTQEYIDTHE